MLLSEGQPSPTAGRACGGLLRQLFGYSHGADEACDELQGRVFDHVRSLFHATWGVVSPGIAARVLAAKE